MYLSGKARNCVPALLSHSCPQIESIFHWGLYFIMSLGFWTIGCLPLAQMTAPLHCGICGRWIPRCARCMGTPAGWRTSSMTLTRDSWSLLASMETSSPGTPIGERQNIAKGLFKSIQFYLHSTFYRRLSQKNSPVRRERLRQWWEKSSPIWRSLSSVYLLLMSPSVDLPEPEHWFDTEENIACHSDKLQESPSKIHQKVDASERWREHVWS